MASIANMATLALLSWFFCSIFLSDL
jgi:hypothetical protein